MVECQLPKLKVASSSLVARSKFGDRQSEDTLTTRLFFENGVDVLYRGSWNL